VQVVNLEDRIAGYYLDSLDIGQALKASALTDQQKHSLLTGCWTPDAAFTFPITDSGKQKRRFSSHGEYAQKAPEFFSILADETTDASGKEQLSISVRYLQDYKLHEDFLQFVEVTDLTGKGLANTLLSTVRNLGFDLTYLRGQGYDGCSTMSGKYCGVQAEIQKSYPRALYFHCSSHILNLALNHSCEVPSIRNAHSQLREVCVFLTGSAKRVANLRQQVETLLPGSSITKVKKFCTTRWTECHTSVITFMSLLDAVIATLEDIGGTADREAASRANAHLLAICSCKFICALVVMESFASLLLPLLKNL
jgi:hypothetical protein